MTRRTASIEPAYFEQLYAENPDPWRFATSEYEREKYAATIAALPRRRFRQGLEVGCSIGVLTQPLALRCDGLLALDVADLALDQARARNPGVRFEQRAIPGQWPLGEYDLIVFSEVLYYLDQAGVEQTAELARKALQPGGCILLVHYLGGTDYPMTGDQAAETFIAASRTSLAEQVRTADYRIDRLDQTSRTG